MFDHGFPMLLYRQLSHRGGSYTGRFFGVRRDKGRDGADAGALCLSLVEGRKLSPGQAQGPRIHVPASPCPYARTKVSAPSPKNLPVQALPGADIYFTISHGVLCNLVVD